MKLLLITITRPDQRVSKPRSGKWKLTLRSEIKCATPSFVGVLPNRLKALCP